MGPVKWLPSALKMRIALAWGWTGADFLPALVGNFDLFLHIFGALTLIQDMNYWFGGLLWFAQKARGLAIPLLPCHYVNKIDFNGSLAGIDTTG